MNSFIIKSFRKYPPSPFVSDVSNWLTPKPPLYHFVLVYPDLLVQVSFRLQKKDQRMFIAEEKNVLTQLNCWRAYATPPPTPHPTNNSAIGNDPLN